MFMQIIFVYLTFLNILGFSMMASDKRKAKKKLWRIPEKTLFLISILGGSIGTLTGMYVFHHKTRHWYFVVGMPAILIAQTAAAIWLTVSR